MKKNEKKETTAQHRNNPNVLGLRADVVEQRITDTLETNYMPYAMSVIVSRAIPEIDGFKPSHRKLLYTMYKMGLLNGARTKSANIVGQTMRLNPHGDAAIYDTMVRLSKGYGALLHPFVDSKGNFGKVYSRDMAWAASRYTEAKLSAICAELFRDIDSDTVDFIDNYDNTMKEPALLPTTFPNILVSANQGIAVGMASQLCGFNLGEVCDTTIAYLKNPDCDLTETLLAPDFPTGGVILGTRGVEEAYRTGRGKIRVRAVTNIETLPNGKSQIIVTELPYMVNKAKLIEKIADLHKEKRIDGITDLRDESNREGTRVVIELRRDANANVILNQLYKHTQMQDTFGVIMLALVDGQPKVLSLLDMLKCYIAHQEDVVTRRTKYDLNKAEERDHILQGLLIAQDHIDEVIQIIRSSQTPQISKDRLIERFGLTDVQAQAIIDMRLRALTGLEHEKLEAEHQELLKKIAELKAILADEKRLLGVIRSELLVIKDKYGDDRRSKIGYDEFDISMEDMIPRENTIIAMTNLGYIKRMTVDNFKAQNRGGRGIKGMQTIEEDFIADLLMTTTHHYVMFFTNFGRVYRLKAYEIPEAGRTARGTAIINLLQLAPEEKISAIIPVKDYEKDDNLFMVTRKGIVKKTPILEYSNVRKNGLAAINLREDDELIEVKVTNADSEIFLVTRDGMCIRFKETDVRNTGRTSMGVIGMTLSDNDEIVGMQLDHQGDSLLIVSENGMGKRTSMDEFTVQHRGGKGVKCYKITEKTGYVIGVKAVTDENEIMMITTEGIIIQIRMDDVSQLGRITSGVKLINLDAGVTVAQIAKVREKVSDGNQEFDDVDDAMEDVSKPSEVDQEEDDDPAEEHITMPEETEEDE